MDIDAWMNDLIDQLKTEFKERLVLVGLQGSRARGEQREDSDIDIVVAIEDLNANDLASYRSVVQRMPHASEISQEHHQTRSAFKATACLSLEAYGSMRPIRKRPITDR